MQQQAGNPP